MINSRLIFDAVMALDLSPDRIDAVKELIDAMRDVYVGIPLPEAVSLPPAEDTNARKQSIEACLMMLKYFQETEKKMTRAKAEPFVLEKNKLNKIRTNLEAFNKAEKPLKVAKKLVKEGFLPQKA
jgi:hypothetical protein